MFAPILLFARRFNNFFPVTVFWGAFMRIIYFCFYIILWGGTLVSANTLQIVNNNSKMDLISDYLDIVISGNNNNVTIRGGVKKITVTGKNNIVDIINIKTIVCTGDKNTFLIPALAKTQNTGTNNRFHYRYYMPLD